MLTKEKCLQLPLGTALEAIEGAAGTSLTGYSEKYHFIFSGIVFGTVGPTTNHEVSVSLVCLRSDNHMGVISCRYSQFRIKREPILQVKTFMLGDGTLTGAKEGSAEFKRLTKLATAIAVEIDRDGNVFEAGVA